MKKTLINLMIIFTISLSIFTFTACSGENGCATPPPHTHEYSATYTYDNDYHWFECECGDKKEMEEHKPGAEATEITAQEFTVCNCVLVPALNHVHNLHLTKVEKKKQSCMQEGNIEYYQCSCNKLFTDKTATTEITNIQSVVIEKDAHNHTILKKTTLEHWYECECGDKGEKEKHKGGIATEYSKAVCSICNQEYGEVLDPPATEGLKYTLINNDTEYEVSNYMGTSTEVTIPSTYKSKPVTSIGDSAFLFCTIVTNVEIPNSVSSIGFQAFAASGLESVNISANVNFIGERAFSGCKKLKNINVDVQNLKYKSKDGNLYSKDELTFIQYACGKKDTIFKFPSVTSISEFACHSAESLTHVEMYYGVESIGESAFYGCINLTSIILCRTLTSIGDDAFYGCNKLEGLIKDGLNYIGNNYGSPYCEYLYLLNVKDKKITTATVSEECKFIASKAFQNCDSLESIIIPDSVTNIGEYVFEYCNSLKTIYCEAESQPSDWDSLWKASCDAEVVWGYKKGTEGLEYILINNDNEYEVSVYAGISTEVVIPSMYNGKPVTSIGDCAFYGCMSLTNIIISANVTDIEANAFSGCDSLTSIIFAENSQLKSIGVSTFYECTRLTSITIPASVTSVDNSAFRYCSSLTSVTFRENSQLTSISDFAFSDCASLTSIIFAENSQLKSIGVSAFYECTRLTNIEIPESVTNIEKGAFSGCDSLTNMEIPASVSYIGYQAFYNCESLQNITVAPSNANYKDIDGNLYSKIGKSLMQYAIGKIDSSFTIPSSVTYIGGYAFYNCKSLISIEIPSSVTYIDDGAFYGCNLLENIEIPSNVTYIGGYAFYNCSKLTIYCEAESNPEDWSSSWNPSKRPVFWGYKAEDIEE